MLSCFKHIESKKRQNAIKELKYCIQLEDKYVTAIFLETIIEIGTS